jgi:hypothetical protein
VYGGISAITACPGSSKGERFCVAEFMNNKQELNNYRLAPPGEHQMKTILALLAAKIFVWATKLDLTALTAVIALAAIGCAVSFTKSAYCYLAFKMTCRVPCVTSASLMKRWWLK